MDLLIIPEATLTNAFLWTLPPHSQISHQKFQKQQILHLKPSHQTGYKLSFRCRKLTLSATECLSNGKAPQHETDLFIYVRGLLYKNVTDWGQNVLALVIPKSWKYTVLVEAHDKLGHQEALAPTVL